MTMIGVRIAALGLALAVLCPSPQAGAFGLRLGPFLFGWRAHHHHSAPRAEADRGAPSRSHAH